MDISYLHVFKYSERDNTEAAEMGEYLKMYVKRRNDAWIISKKTVLSMKVNWEVLEQFF
jgi:tRNA A37 methylthiotransferase MiaB